MARKNVKRKPIKRTWCKSFIELTGEPDFSPSIVRKCILDAKHFGPHFASGTLNPFQPSFQDYAITWVGK